MPRAIKVSLLDRNMKVAVSHCSDKETSEGEEGGGIGSYCDRGVIPWKRSNCVRFGIWHMLLKLNKNQPIIVQSLAINIFNLSSRLEIVKKEAFVFKSAACPSQPKSLGRAGTGGWSSPRSALLY